MKKKHIVSFILAALLIISTLVPMAAFAAQAPGEEALEPQTITTCSRSFIAISNTKARATVDATSSGDTSYITSKITLQYTNLGGGNYSNVPGVDPETKTVNNVTIVHICTFNISSNYDYRIKVEVTDCINGIPVTKTYYKSLDR